MGWTLECKGEFKGTSGSESKLQLFELGIALTGASKPNNLVSMLQRLPCPLINKTHMHTGSWPRPVQRTLRKHLQSGLLHQE